FGDAPDGLLEVLIGSAGRVLVDDPRVPLISATGSTAMGQNLAPRVASRLGRSLLDLAVRAIVFSAVGTAGQRCTSLRRLIVHEDVADGLLDRLERAYASVKV